ncbi:MAG: FMN-binding protein, partial [Gammaproteobacteria bacterium]|nr:FMN-binding protein [Gammaproteobacteria bacterium]
MQKFFSDANRFTAFTGTPPAAEVYHNDTLLGYVFVTDDVVRIPAYSGKPVNLLVGVNTAGVITGAEVLEHHEPILLVGIPEQKLFDFAAQYVDKHVGERIRVGAGKQEGYVNVDAVSGATVTVLVVNQSIMRSARKIATSRSIIDPTQQAQTQPGRVLGDVFRTADWPTLIGEGSIRRLHLNYATVEQAFAGTEGEGKGPQPESDCSGLPADDPCHTFIDLYYTYLNAPTIGRNLLGDFQYDWLMGELKPEEHAIAILANGVYSFKGSGYVRGGIFDRIQLAQGDRTVTFRDLDHHRLSDVFTANTPRFREMAIYIIRDSAEFDPGGDWQVELLVSRATGPLDRVFTSFGGEYRLLDAYVDRPAPPPVVADEE